MKSTKSLLQDVCSAAGINQKKSWKKYKFTTDVWENRVPLLDKQKVLSDDTKLKKELPANKTFQIQKIKCTCFLEP